MMSKRSAANKLPPGGNSKNIPPDSHEYDITEDTIPRVYMGLLDDVMIRYSGDYASEDFFNRMIAKSVFFGDGMYINDGYLVNHDTARKSLGNPNSLLSYLIATGNIQVLTRMQSAKDLEQMPDSMAAQNNPSFMRLIKRSDWKDFQTKTWRGLAVGIFRNRHHRPWPSWNGSEGFTNLMRRVFSGNAADVGLSLFTDEEFCKVMAEFLRREPWKGNARAMLEDAAVYVLTGLSTYDPKSLRPAIRKKMANLMDVANQAYHYNFALCLSAEEDKGIAADTTIGKAFDELLQAHEVDEYTLQQIDGLDLFSLPRGLPYDDGSVFWEFLNPQSSAFRAKLNYLVTLSRLVTATEHGVDEVKANMVDASRRYVSQIKATLRKKFRGIDKLFEEHDSRRNKLQSMYLGLGDAKRAVASAAPTPVLALQLPGAAANMSESIRSQQFKVRDSTSDFRSEGEGASLTIKLKHVRPHLSSVAVTRHAAKTHVRHLTPFVAKPK